MAEWAKESLEMQMELIENFQKLANRHNNMLAQTYLSSNEWRLTDALGAFREY
jgi:hypothetical protein